MKPEQGSEVYNQIIPTLLEVVPEIKEQYVGLGEYNLSDKDIEVMDRIRKIHDLPYSDRKALGATIVFETILVPFIISLLNDLQKKRRLSEITKWIETLANHEDFWIRNLIATSICEPLLTTYEDKLPKMFDYLGIKTKKMCKKQLNDYILEDATIHLFISV